MNMSVNQAIAKFIGGVNALTIPRLEDLPYFTSPPVQFVYESTATLSLGRYVWNDSPTLIQPNRKILAKAIYYFRNISLTADVTELDFTTNIFTTPTFSTFLKMTNQGPLFREPIRMTKFFDQFDYRLCWQTERRDDELRAAFTGRLDQGAGLIGKDTITLKAVIVAQEINDENFIELFKLHYPAVPKEV